jgi:hypothetical protein
MHDCDRSLAKKGTQVGKRILDKRFFQLNLKLLRQDMKRGWSGDEVVKSFVGDGFTIVLYTAIVQR